MGATRERPAIRACIFDMDGLLINSEDIYSEVTNSVLKEHGKPSLPWSVKADLQGRPGTEATARLLEWSQLPYSPDELYAIFAQRQQTRWKDTVPMPGAVELLQKLKAAQVPIALATSSHRGNYLLKTAHLGHLFGLFDDDNMVLGDDPRIPKGRGKPAPDIWLVALATLNAKLPDHVELIKPEECLIFEDGIPGVMGAKAAGCQVVWVPHPMILKEFEDTKHEIVGEWGEVLPSLAVLEFEKYGL
ncbi:HAD-like domain-containing protein [Lipomyces tetrasporus]|uniref:HAD-like domain-containing protein n=1 Tax=Lipomyces tetrasporus TaxID=54092 RepID=A0AAD7QT46_9ASCO|nr:HAD-like domain-containing protein [Lipomyces tetrasporus]KAJ8100521.1 HAD-like domain-containing protein [Lipomyces tetrasporus]